jgi:hypothetical protein
LDILWLWIAVWIFLALPVFPVLSTLPLSSNQHPLVAAVSGFARGALVLSAHQRRETRLSDADKWSDADKFADIFNMGWQSNTLNPKPNTPTLPGTKHTP